MKIIQGEIPCFKVYENEHVFAFLAKDQIQAGHTLVIPKVEVDYFVDVEEPYYTEVFRAAKKISRAIEEVTGCRRVGMMVLGLEVPHFHVHLVPLQRESDLNFEHAREFEEPRMLKIQSKLVAALAAHDGEA